MTSFSPVAGPTPILIADSPGATTPLDRAGSPRGSSGPRMTPEARGWVEDYSDGKGRLTPALRFNQAAALLREAGAEVAPLEGRHWASGDAQRSLGRSGYNPDEVLSSRVRELMAVDNAFAAWRGLPSPLGPADGLLDTAVNHLAARLKGDFARAAARLDTAAGLYSRAIEPNGPGTARVTRDEGTPVPGTLDRITQPEVAKLGRDYRAARQAADAAMDRLRSLSDLLSTQARSGRVNPWDLMRELPDLRPVLTNFLRP